MVDAIVVSRYYLRLGLYALIEPVQGRIMRNRDQD